MPDKLVTLRTYPDYLQANIAKGLLEENGIPAFVAGESSSTLFGVTAVSLQVPEERFDEASEILDAVRDDVEGEQGDNREHDWEQEQWIDETGGESDDEDDQQDQEW
jgi:hypothetical protein